jgi:thymidine kinase
MSSTSYHTKPSGELHLIIGVMYAGKTTELLRRLFNETVAGLKCIYINHEKDTRSEEPFSTHNPLYKKQLSRESGVNLVSAKRVRDVDVEEYDIIGIDEAHFFGTDLVNDVVNLVDNEKKTVIVVGLNGDMKRTNIGYIVGLIPHMDSCTFLTAYCKRCAEGKIKSNAIFSYKFGTGDDVGGPDKYIPLCRSCFNNTL